MKNMISIFCFSLMVMLSTTTFAQHKKAHHKHQKDSAWIKMSQRLQLSDEQQTKAKETIKLNRQELKALRERTKDLSKDERKKAMLEQLRKNDERINALLNDSQKAEYKKIKTERLDELKKRKAAKKQQNQVIDDELLNELDGF